MLHVMFVPPLFRTRGAFKEDSSIYMVRTVVFSEAKLDLQCVDVLEARLHPVTTSPVIRDSGMRLLCPCRAPTHYVCCCWGTGPTLLALERNRGRHVV